MSRIVGVLILLLIGCTLLAQEAPKQPANPDATEPGRTPPTEAESLAPMPSPPYVKEDITVLESHLKVFRAGLKNAIKTLDAATKAEKEEGLSPEELNARKITATGAKTVVLSLKAQIKVVEDALKGKAKFPTRSELDAQNIHDSKLARIKAILKQLTLKPKIADSANAEEGDTAKVLRTAVESYLHIAQVVKASRERDGKSHPLHEELSGLEKLDFRLRIAQENLQLAVSQYEALHKDVFDAFQNYETLAIQAVQLYLEIKDGKPDAMAIASLWRERVKPFGRSAQTDEEFIERLNLRDFEGRLKQIQKEIDIREDLRDQLQSSYDQLKDIESRTSKTAEPADAEAVLTDGIEQYAVLSKEIDDLKQEKRDNEDTLIESGSFIERAQQALDTKNTTVKEVTKFLEESETLLSNLSNAEPLVLLTSSGRTFKGGLEVAAFKANESLNAEKERLLNAQRDSKSAETELEIQVKRKESLVLRNSTITDSVLPNLRRKYYEELGRTIGWRALKVLLVLLGAFFFIRLSKWIGEPLIERIVRRSDDEDAFSADEKQRARTLMTVFMTTSRLLIYMLAIMFSIAQFDVNYGPLLVAAGGLSLAVGFGAQSLVKDFFSGFFILLEGQFSIGDVVEVGGKIGTVESLNLRTTVLRSLNGDVHVIPNGNISATTNMTKEWSRAVVDVGVAYEENTDDVTKVMEAVAEEMSREKVWNRKLLEHFMMGVQELGDSSVTLRILLKTRAGEQWGIAREYRRRCKLKFDELGIEIPWPQMVMTNKEISSPDHVKKAKVQQYVTEHKTVEDPELEGMSIEERDRAELLAKREVELADETDTRNDDRKEDELSDAEKWAKKQTTQMTASERRKRVEERSKTSTEDNDEGGGDADE
ncbi:MAG: mechanosensitive ion channel [Planctomycetes bacterium]|nr:mechanosensitive ion channel [Planctomycetota bacterium]